MIQNNLRHSGAAYGTEVLVNEGAGCLRINVTSPLSESETTAVGEQIGTAIRALVRAGVAYGQIRTMLDFRAAGILPQAVIEAAQRLARDHGPASSRVAIVCTNALQRMQQKRIATADNLHFFLDETEAWAWLLS